MSHELALDGGRIIGVILPGIGALTLLIFLILAIHDHRRSKR